MKARTGQSVAYLREALRTVGALVVVLGLIALGLRILHLVPPVLAPEPVRAYATVEEARRSTGVPVYLPAYFPEYLQWPPQEVRGRVEPQPRVSITVALRDSEQPVLWLEEWLPHPGEPPLDVPKTALVSERETVVLREGVEADVVGYRDVGAQLFYWLTWDQKDVRFSLTAALPRDELLRMARSMYPPPSY